MKKLHVKERKFEEPKLMDFRLTIIGQLTTLLAIIRRHLTSALYNQALPRALFIRLWQLRNPPYTTGLQRLPAQRLAKPPVPRLVPPPAIPRAPQQPHPTPPSILSTLCRKWNMLTASWSSLRLSSLWHPLCNELLSQQSQQALTKFQVKFY